MNKSEIVGRVALRMGLSKSVAEGAVDTVLAAIGEALAEDVRIAGFGKFATRNRPARAGRNPRTGESVAIPASKVPPFKAGKALREVVNGGWEEGSGEAAEDEYGPGETGLRTDLSKWPGGVEPVWTMLESESVEALRAEPLPENRTLRLAADLTDEELEHSAFVRNALAVLERTAGEEWLWLTEKGNFGRGAARVDDLARDGGDRAVPHGEGVSRGGRVGASSSASAGGSGRAGRGADRAVPIDRAGARNARTGKTGRASGASVPPRLLARRPFALRGDVSPGVAGPVAAG